jgi:hypothetical protein
MTCESPLERVAARVSVEITNLKLVDIVLRWWVYG